MKLLPPVLALAAEKQAWIAQQPASSAARRGRFGVLRELTGKLRPHVAGRLKGLEDENRRLKKLLAESMLDNAALKDLLGKNV